MDVYTHVAIQDQASAVECLPPPPSADEDRVVAEKCRATGTDGKSVGPSTRAYPIAYGRSEEQTSTASAPPSRKLLHPPWHRNDCLIVGSAGQARAQPPPCGGQSRRCMDILVKEGGRADYTVAGSRPHKRNRPMFESFGEGGAEQILAFKHISLAAMRNAILYIVRLTQCGLHVGRPILGRLVATASHGSAAVSTLTSAECSSGSRLHKANRPQGNRLP